MTTFLSVIPEPLSLGDWWYFLTQPPLSSICSGGSIIAISEWFSRLIVSHFLVELIVRPSVPLGAKAHSFWRCYSVALETWLNHPGSGQFTTRSHVCLRNRYLSIPFLHICVNMFVYVHLLLKKDTILQKPVWNNLRCNVINIKVMTASLHDKN